MNGATKNRKVVCIVAVVVLAMALSFASLGDQSRALADDIPGLEWDRTFGGASSDYGFSVQQTSDGGYIVAGQTYSYGAGDDDVWLIEVASSVNHSPNTPSNPSPADNATMVHPSANLSWTGGDPDVGDTVTYDVYFGSSEGPPMVSNDQSGTTYDPGILADNTKYYWKVVASDNHEASTDGPVWDFTTSHSDPNPYFVVDNVEVAIGETVTFDPTLTFGGTLPYTRIRWDFEGDGSWDKDLFGIWESATLPITTWSYDAEGAYHPCLEITDSSTPIPAVRKACMFDPYSIVVGDGITKITWNLPYGLDADPAAVNIWTYPSYGVEVTLADVDATMPDGLLIWHYGGPTEGWRFYKKGWGAVNTLETLVPDNGYIGIVPTAGVWEIPQVPILEVLWQSPLYDERFVQGETVQLKATVEAGDGSQLQWISDLDGFLGKGTLVNTSDLSVGEHSITVSGYGSSETFPVRVFANLGELYASPPAEGEIQRILNDFTFDWLSGSGVDEDWSLYDSFDFDQTSTAPSKVVIIAKLDVSRHQRFSEPLPMTSGETIYDHLRTYVHTIQLRLDCDGAWGGGGQISLHRSSSVWDARTSDDCKTPRTPLELYPYIYQLQLLVHEGRHCMPDDPGHTDCGQGGPYSKDQQLEGGGGYAWGAMYYMWVYECSLYDPPEIRDAAREGAWGVLSSRFCTTPSHSDRRVQAIIDELLAGA